MRITQKQNKIDAVKTISSQINKTKPLCVCGGKLYVNPNAKVKCKNCGKVSDCLFVGKL